VAIDFNQVDLSQALGEFALQEKKHALRVFNEHQNQPTLASEVLNRTAQRLDPMAAELALATHIACQKGCSWCCRGSRVNVGPPEAIAIAEWILARDADQQLDLITRVNRTAEVVQKTNADDRWIARMPCAFLDAQGACEIYPVRPLACRMGNSFDAATCQRAHETGEGVASDSRIRVVYAIGRAAIERAAHDNKLQFGYYELSTAVALALHTADAAPQWATGSDLFERARTPNDAYDAIAASQAAEQWQPAGAAAPGRDDVVRSAQEGRSLPMPPIIEQALAYGSPSVKNRRKRDRRARRG
jgi:Fe-S-cluster containining protein